MSYTTTNTYNGEALRQNVPEQVGKRAAVLSTAGHLLGLREFVATDAVQAVNEGPVIDRSMSVEQQRQRITDLKPFPIPMGTEGQVLDGSMTETEKRERVGSLQPFTAADPTSQDDYINAIASDNPAPVADPAAAARAALKDIFGGNN